MDYEEGAVMKIWSIMTEYIHDDEAQNETWNRMQLRPNEILRNFLSRVGALCGEYRTMCHIKKHDPEILALVMNLSLFEGSADG